MTTISRTRMELLARRRQITLARQGHDLLEQKRSALLAEFMQMAHELMESASQLEKESAAARHALARAEAFAGPEAVRSAALAERRELELRVDVTTVGGLRVPAIEQRQVARSVFNRGYDVVGTSTTIDEAASAFEGFIESIIELAEQELRLKLLADEISRLTRRINALEHVLLPRLQREKATIQLALDERERGDRFRLKRAKSLIVSHHNTG